MDNKHIVIPRSELLGLISKGVKPLEIIRLQCATERENNPYKRGNNKITCLQQSNIADYDSFDFFNAMAEYMSHIILKN